MFNSNLIWEKKNSLDKETCQGMINKFIADPDKGPGLTASGLNLDIKKSTDLDISGSNSWKSFDTKIFESLTREIEEYKKYVIELDERIKFPFYPIYDAQDTGYQIQMYDASKSSDLSGFYNWHDDFCVDKSGTRILTFMWYLNDVIEGGETEFIDGTKIKPEEGKIVIFPATWEMVHRANPPISNNKYICTGWIYIKLKADLVNQ
jgi:hypothetical protein